LINEDKFNGIKNAAAKYAYSSFEYLEYDICRNAELLFNTPALIALYDESQTPAVFHYAADSFEALINGLNTVKGGVRVNLVPLEFARGLEGAGFSVLGEYVDYFNQKLSDTYIKFADYGGIEFLDREGCERASLISRLCAGQSRGFSGETAEWFSDWIVDGDVILIRSNTVIAGFCCVSIYNGGTTLWLRELAVAPEYQRRGLGGGLIERAICYGAAKGANKGFLAVDVLNDNAIRLYKKYNFTQRGSESELQMVRV
jgi:GNAT superfamily N-acetyltransferase